MMTPVRADKCYNERGRLTRYFGTPVSEGNPLSQMLKIAVPLAGYGSRMRPHTWSKPKPLIPLAGQTVLDHVLAQFNSLPAGQPVEYVLIVGPYQQEQVEAHMRRQHPDKTFNIVVQPQMRGQSDALWLAREHLTGPMLMSFGDTFIETDLSRVLAEPLDGIAWVKPVPDPRPFGVAALNPQGLITRLIEKPQTLENNRVVVGFYYFRSGEKLMDVLDQQIRSGVTLKNEFFLTDALNLWIEQGARLRTETVEVWLDAGRPDALLETNRWLLDHGRGSAPAERPGVTIIPPVAIHPSAVIEGSVIGPHVSLGANCQVRGCVLRDTIVDTDTTIENLVLEGSIIGRTARVHGQPRRLNIGDNSQVDL